MNNKTSETTKKAVSYLVRLTAQKLLGFLFYLVGTGFVFYATGVVYFCVLIAATLWCGVVIFRANEQTLAERGKTDTDSPKWDKLLLGLFWLLNYFVVYLFAGLGEESNRGLGILFFVGLAVTLAAGWITLRATLENTYLESTARLQTDRGQTVCDTGPYAVVRHPAYLSVLVNCVGLWMIFPCAGVAVCSLVIIAIIVVRTALEDKMLQEGLAGYKEYVKRVRYRLIPFVW